MQRPPASSWSGHLFVGDRPDQRRRYKTNDSGDGVSGGPGHAEPGVGLDDEQDAHDGGDERLVVTDERSLSDTPSYKQAPDHSTGTGSTCGTNASCMAMKGCSVEMFASQTRSP